MLLIASCCHLDAVDSRTVETSTANIKTSTHGFDQLPECQLLDNSVLKARAQLTIGMHSRRPPTRHSKVIGHAFCV